MVYIIWIVTENSVQSHQSGIFSAYKEDEKKEGDIVIWRSERMICGIYGIITALSLGVIFANMS